MINRIPSYKKAIEKYNKNFKRCEITQILEADEQRDIIIRLDGKSLSKSFSINDSSTDYLIYYDAMKYVIKELYKHYNFITLVYSYKDELSILIDKNKLKDYPDMNRVEKILSLLAGLISSLFTKYINREGIKSICYFDARIIKIETSNISKYFQCRHELAIRAFYDSSKKYLTNKTDKRIFKIVEELKCKKIKLNDSIINGVIAYYTGEKWQLLEKYDEEIINKAILTSFDALRNK